MLGGHSPPPRVAEHQMYMLPLGSLQVEGARCEDQDPLQEQEPHHPPPAGGRESRQMGSLQPLFWGGLWKHFCLLSHWPPWSWWEQGEEKRREGWRTGWAAPPQQGETHTYAKNSRPLTKEIFIPLAPQETLTANEDRKQNHLPQVHR